MTKAEIIEYLYDNHVHGDLKIEEIAEDLSADPVSVVRCKDCRYYIPFEWMFGVTPKSSKIEDYLEDEIGCSMNDCHFPPNGFCSHGDNRRYGSNG